MPDNRTRYWVCFYPHPFYGHAGRCAFLRDFHSLLRVFMRRVAGPVVHSDQRAWPRRRRRIRRGRSAEAHFELCQGLPGGACAGPGNSPFTMGLVSWVRRGGPWAASSASAAARVPVSGVPVAQENQPAVERGPMIAGTARCRAATVPRAGWCAAALARVTCPPCRRAGRPGRIDFGQAAEGT